MKIVEAVVYLLATAGCGMSTDTLAWEIDLQVSSILYTKYYACI